MEYIKETYASLNSEGLFSLKGGVEESGTVPAADLVGVSCHLVDILGCAMRKSSVITVPVTYRVGSVLQCGIYLFLFTKTLGTLPTSHQVPRYGCFEVIFQRTEQSLPRASIPMSASILVS